MFNSLKMGIIKLMIILILRRKRMPKSGFVKGLVTGAVVGIAMTNIVNPIDSNDVKRWGKGTHKAFSTIGNVVDGIVNAVR
jgi:Na+/proline symporter